MSAGPPMPASSKIWPRLGAIILVCVCLYYGYVAVNTLGLSNHTGVATVLGKAYYPPGTSYQAMKIGSQTLIRPYQTAEMYVLKLQLNNQETPAIVDKALYDVLGTNAEVDVDYQVTRITKVTQVLQVNADALKGAN